MTQICVKDKSMVAMDETINTNKRNKWAFAAILGFVVLTMIIGATMIGVYIGRNMAKDIYEEAWAVYKDTNTGSIVKQRYIVDGNEVLVVKPGEISIIYDLEKGHIVMQVEDMRYTVTNDCLCFVYGFEKNAASNLGDFIQDIKDKDIEVTGSFPVTEFKIKPTGHTFDLSHLSRRSKEMCHGCKVLKTVMENVSEFPRKKRKTTSGYEHISCSLNFDLRSCEMKAFRCSDEDAWWCVR